MSEKIKRGLECSPKDECFGDREDCPYVGVPSLCVGAMCRDAHTYIRQLEQDNAQKDERIRKLERERETLLAGIKLHGGICMMCEYYSTPEYELPCGNCCVIYPNDREAENLWEWRGVEDDEHA